MNAATSARAGFPFANSKVAVFMTKAIDAISYKKSQREIALEVGYEKPNIVSMMKRGETRVPLDKIPAFAEALEVDPAHLFRLALEQYWPDQEKAIAAVFGTVVTADEAKVIKFIRKRAKALTAKEVMEKLERAFPD